MRIEAIDYAKSRPDHEWCGLQTVFWHIVPEDGDDTRLPSGDPIPCLWKDYVTREQAQAALDTLRDQQLAEESVAC